MIGIAYGSAASLYSVLVVGFLHRFRASSSAPRHGRVLAEPLLQFSPKDLWRVEDAVQGTQIFGATGSG